MWQKDNWYIKMQYLLKLFLKNYFELYIVWFEPKEL